MSISSDGFRHVMCHDTNCFSSRVGTVSSCPFRAEQCAVFVIVLPVSSIDRLYKFHYIMQLRAW